MKTFRYVKSLTATDHDSILARTEAFAVLVEDVEDDDGVMADLLPLATISGLAFDARLRKADLYAARIPLCHATSIRYGTNAPTSIPGAIVELIRTRPAQVKDLRVNLAAFAGTPLFEALAASEVTTLHLYDMPTPEQRELMATHLPRGLLELGVYQETPGMRGLLAAMLERPIERLVLRNVSADALALSAAVTSLTMDVRVRRGDDATFVTPALQLISDSGVRELTLYAPDSALPRAGVKLVLALKKRLRCVRFARASEGGDARASNGVLAAQLFTQISFSSSAIDSLDLSDFRVSGGAVDAGIQAIFHSRVCRLRHLRMEYHGEGLELINSLRNSPEHILRSVDFRNEQLNAFWAEEEKALRGRRNLRTLIMAGDAMPGAYINPAALRDFGIKFLASTARRPS